MTFLDKEWNYSFEKNEGLWKVRKIQQEKSRLIQESLKKKN